MDHDDDARLSLEARCNYVVDHGAGRSARSGKLDELAYYHPHHTPHPHTVGPAHLTVLDATIYDDPSHHARRHTGLRAALAAWKGPNKSGRVIAMMAHGLAHSAHTAHAKTLMTAHAEGAALRAALGRTRSSVRELTYPPPSHAADRRLLYGSNKHTELTQTNAYIAQTQRKKTTNTGGLPAPLPAHTVTVSNARSRNSWASAEQPCGSTYSVESRTSHRRQRRPVKGS